MIYKEKEGLNVYFADGCLLMENTVIIALGGIKKEAGC